MVVIRGPWPEPEDSKGARRDSPRSYNAARPLGRFAGDEPHLRRFEHKAPKGLPMKLVQNVPVAGIAREPFSENAARFMAGEELGLDLERDPGNDFDPNSIKVLGIWRDAESGSVKREQIGWVPATLAREIAEKAGERPIGATIRVVFLPRQGYSPGLRFDIWQPRGGQRIWWVGRA